MERYEAMRTPLSMSDLTSMLAALGARVNRQATHTPVVLSTEVNVKGDTLKVKGKETKGPVIVLLVFPTQTVGHFVCMWKDKGWHYFDPTGKPMGFYHVLPKFTHVQSNDVEYQGKYAVGRNGDGAEAGEMSTCGRHCVVRAVYSDLNPAEYYRFMTQTGYSPDKLVTVLTE